MLPVVFRPQAEGETLEVRRWYELRSPGLGEHFAQAMEAMITRISERPLAFPAVHGETRRAVFRRFPYAIYFRAAEHAVVILAVHGRQHPSNWRDRS